MSYTYKNKAQLPQMVPSVGLIDADATITVDEPFENPNFELIDGDAIPVERPVEQPIAPQEQPLLQTDAAGGIQ